MTQTYMVVPGMTCQGGLGQRIGGGITPEIPDGWRPCGANFKIANGRAGFLRRGSFFTPPRNVVCRFEVGVPQQLAGGRRIGDAEATADAITAITAGAATVNAFLRASDPEGLAPEALICQRLRQAVQLELQALIPGARVAPIGTSRCP